MLELIYTASPKGLISGRSGFTTVAMTDGFPPNLISPLENLSGYKNLFPPESPEAAKNPANFIFQHYNSGATKYYVVSRITYAGLSYTGRCNNLAHHLIFSREEIEAIPGGAAMIVANGSNFPEYQSPPHLLPPRSKLHSLPAENTSAWEKLCGNADWAKIIAERYRLDKTRCAILQFSPDTTTAEQILSLIAEVTALLTPEEYADFTFSTYCYQSTIGNPIYFRAYPEESNFLSSIKRLNPNSVLVIGKDNPISSDDAQMLARFHEREAMAQRKAQAEKEKNKVTGPQQNLSRQVKENNAANPVSTTTPDTQGKPPRRPAPLDIHPVPDLAGKMPWLILSGVLLIVCIILAVRLMPKSSDMTPEKTAVRQTIPASEPDQETVSTEQATSSPQAEQTQEDIGGVSSSEGNADVHAPVAPKEESVEATPPLPTDLTLEQRFAFYEKFKHEQSRKISLPALVANGKTLDISLSSLGSQTKLPNELLSKALLKNGSACTILPLKTSVAQGMFGESLTVDADTPAQAMTLKISDGQLIIKAPPPGEMVPGYNNITSLSIDGHLLYERKFSSEFVAILQNKSSFSTRLRASSDGQLILKYSVSDNLLKHKNDVTLCFLLTNVNNRKTLQRTLPLSEGEQEYKIDYSLKKCLDKRAALLAKCESFDQDQLTFNGELDKLMASLKYDFSSVHQMEFVSEDEIDKRLYDDDDDDEDDEDDRKSKKSKKHRNKKHSRKSSKSMDKKTAVQALENAKNLANSISDKFNGITKLLGDFKTSADYSALQTETKNLLDSMEIYVKEFSHAIDELDDFEDILKDKSKYEHSEQLSKKLELMMPQLKKNMKNNLARKQDFLTKACKKALEDEDIKLQSELEAFLGEKKYEKLVKDRFDNPDAQQRPISAKELKPFLAEQFTIRLFLQGN